jgi:two-component sensor histidine kinase
MAQAATIRQSPSSELSDSLLFVSELGHRVANEHALLIAAVSAAAARSPSAETRAALSQVRDFLFAYAEVHRALQPPLGEDFMDLSTYLEHACGAIVRASLGPRGVELLLLEEPIKLDAARCWRVALIVSELINNALRHAFSQHAGKIILDVRNQNGVVHCQVTDNGRPTFKPEPGHGSRIVDALAAEMGGRIQRSFCEYGVTVLLSFPLNADGNPRRANAPEPTSFGRPAP